MKILIIEDEPLAAAKLQQMVAEISSQNEVIAVTESVEQSIDWLAHQPAPDLILSDIHLSDGICFKIFEEVKTNCPIIFTTAYEKYAIQAFEVNSIDYLLKPIQKDRLKIAIQRMNERTVATSNKSLLFNEFKTILSQSNREYKSRFLCKLGSKIKSIPTENISYFYSQNKITFIMHQGGQRFPINNTLDEIDQNIDPKYFFRVNRKYIVNYEAIHEMNPYFKGRLKLKLQPQTEEDIVVSTEKTPLFKSWLDR